MLPVTLFQAFTFVAIDPGLNNVGVAIYRVQVNPFAVLSIQAFTLKAERLVDTSGLDDDAFTERLHKRHSMASAFRKVLEEVNPCLVVCESPFFDRRKPGSFAVLTEVMTTLLDTVTAYNPVVRFSVVEPQLVKKVLGVAGQKGKDVVRDAMEKETLLIAALSTPLNFLDEHGVDAIGVGYTYLVKKSGIFPQST